MSVVPKYKGKKLYKNITDLEEDYWDAIVIGSGIGGMSCAAALSKCGEKVLVLEQHYIPGGFTHMFARKGYEMFLMLYLLDINSIFQKISLFRIL